MALRQLGGWRRDEQAVTFEWNIFSRRNNGDTRDFDRKLDCNPGISRQRFPNRNRGSAIDPPAAPESAAAPIRSRTAAGRG